MVELLEVNEQFIGQIADRIATNGPRCGGTDAMVEVETAEPAAPSCGDMRLRGQHNRAAALTKPSVNGLGSWSDKSMPGSTIAWAAGGLARPLAAERKRMRPFGMAGQRGCPGYASPGRFLFGLALGMSRTGTRLAFAPARFAWHYTGRTRSKKA